MSSNAFNPHTKAIITPFVDESPTKVRVSPKKLEINKRLLNHSMTVRRGSEWQQRERSNLIRMKSAYRRKSPAQTQSIDLGASKSNLQTTYTSGFYTTQASSGFAPTNTAESFNTTSRGGSKYTRRYGKYKMSNMPTYDFTGGDTPWLNKVGVNTKVKGTEQNFKITHTTYDREFDSARPIAYSKGRKYCSMTRFMKNLEDNRIFQRGKMSAYRPGR